MAKNKMDKGVKPGDVGGPEGMVLRIIHLATVDALKGDLEALEYFEGPNYQDHLAWLNLPSDFIPVAILDEGILGNR